MNFASRLLSALLLISIVNGFPVATLSSLAEGAKPRLVYSRYYNAKGESRYLPDGTYKVILQKLGAHYDVRVSEEVPSKTALQDVKVVVIANPSERRVGNNPEPNHFQEADILALTEFVRGGGGLLIMGNQENHNLELKTTNRLLEHFGVEFGTNYTDAKLIHIPKSAPAVGGLKWGYYTGNSIQILKSNEAKVKVLVDNDTTQVPAGGPRNAKGSLLVGCELGKGRVVVATDAGWLTDTALDDRGIGGVRLVGQQNLEVCLGLLNWLNGGK